MKLTRSILSDLTTKIEDIDYYYSLVELIKINVDENPDVSIESCKSLLEGISKFILINLDHSQNRLSLDKLDFPKLFKSSLQKLSEYNSNIEVDFVNRACSLIQSIGEIRNKRGDISHGKLAPKETFSDTLFSNLVVTMTDGIAFYILKCFSTSDYIQEIRYEENTSFNEWLDEMNPIEKLIYSKALFDQDINLYKQELFDYNENPDIYS